jgi:hypothetical protein
MAALPWEATKAAVSTVASYCRIRMFPGTPLWESCKESSSAIFKLRDQKELAKLSNDILQIIRVLNNLSPIGCVERSKELTKLSTDILQIIRILNNLLPIGHVERSKELAKLSTDIPQTIGILKIMRSTQII